MNIGNNNSGENDGKNCVAERNIYDTGHNFSLRPARIAVRRQNIFKSNKSKLKASKRTRQSKDYIYKGNNNSGENVGKNSIAEGNIYDTVHNFSLFPSRITGRRENIYAQTPYTIV